LHLRTPFELRVNPRTGFHPQSAKTRRAQLPRKGIRLPCNLGEFTIFPEDLQCGIGAVIVAATDSASFAPEAAQEDEIVLEPGEKLA
jgi:hypothetical protein